MCTRRVDFPRGLAALLVGAALTVTPATLRAVEPAAAPETVVSREMCSGLFLVPLEWRSGKSGRTHELLAVFDTGGSNAYIDPDSLEKASGTRVQSGTRVRMSNVSVAGEPFSKFRPRVRDLDHLARALGRPFDVFLPFQTFASYLLTLDYGRQEMRIAAGSLPEPDGKEIFSARGRDSRPWLRARVGSKKRRLLIDSGSNGSISIRHDAGLEWLVAPTPLRLAQGMDDLELSGVGRLAGSVELGPLIFDEPIVALTDDTELLGARILRHYLTTFDQQHRRVRMQPAVEGPVRLPPRRGTGALFRTRPGAYEVAHVVPDSPADRAGIREGDRVTHIDGVPVLERGCRAIDEPQPQEHQFTVRRGDDQLEIVVPVEVLIR